MFVCRTSKEKLQHHTQDFVSHGKETTTLEQLQLRSPQCQQQTSDFLSGKVFFISGRFISFTRTDHSNVFNPLHKIRIKFVLQAGRQAGRQTRETMNTKSINRQESFSKSIYCRRKCLKQPSLRRPLASHNSCRQAGKLTDRQEKQLTRKACIERNHSQNKSTESI